MQLNTPKASVSGRRRRALRASACLGLAMALMTLGACSDDPPERQAARPVAREAPAIHQMKRLDRGAEVKPELWLASREAGQDLPETAAEVAATRELLEVAGKRFRDYPRMIANRAVQLENMLQSNGMGEPAIGLISELSEVPGDHRFVESFASLSQQYFNLRLQGRDRQEALNLLKKHGGETSN